jgi:methylation protein EvaC
MTPMTPPVSGSDSQMGVCVSCDRALEPMVNLGTQPLANRLQDSPGKPDITYRAVWGWCSSCELLQLIDIPPAEVVFGKDYPFLTSTSKFMESHFSQLASRIMERSRPRSFLEIGCNDGGIVKHIPAYVERLGFEPAEACWPALLDGSVPWEGRHFTLDVARELNRTFDVVATTYTARSIATLGDFLKGIATILDPITGVLIIEEPYLPMWLERHEWDQLYNENIWCFTTRSLNAVAERCGLRVVNVEILPHIHGGSARWYLSLRGAYPRTWTCKEQLREEAGVESALRGLQEMVDRSAIAFRSEILRLWGDDKTVVGYAATAKSVTMLNYVKAYPDLLSCVYDTTPSKWGKYMPGTNIPICDAAELETANPDVIVLLAYNHMREIIGRLDPELSRKWLVYHPETKYITREDIDAVV